jgi:hypothetical protein
MLMIAVVEDDTLGHHHFSWIDRGYTDPIKASILEKAKPF